MQQLNERFVLFLRTIGATPEDYYAARDAADGDPTYMNVRGTAVPVLMEYTLWNSAMMNKWAKSLGHEDYRQAMMAACELRLTIVFVPQRLRRYSEADCAAWIAHQVNSATEGA